MANAFRLSNRMAKALADAFTATADLGSAVLIRIYSGTQPTDPDTALSGNTLLAELTMSATSFGAAADANPGGRITANAITSDSSADATGTATFFRMIDQNAGNVLCDGSVGTSGCDINFNTTAFTAGSTVAISSLTVTMPET